MSRLHCINYLIILRFIPKPGSLQCALLGPKSKYYNGGVSVIRQSFEDSTQTQTFSNEKFLWEEKSTIVRVWRGIYGTICLE